MSNSTEFHNELDSADLLEEAVDEYLIILPIIVILGLSGNIISLVTIFHSRLRHVKANVYLIVLTTSDSVFLISLMLVCFKVDWLAYSYCVLIEYILMTASYISSWSTAFLTIERYFAIAHPLKHVRYGHVDRSRMLLYWIPIPFVLHLYQFFSLVPSNDSNNRACLLREANFQIIAQALDTILCYLLPCFIIVILNIMVAYKIRKPTAFTREEKTSRRTKSTSNSGTWTRILWAMPLVFVILNTPFYVIMMIEVVSQVLYAKNPLMGDRSPLFLIIYNTAHYMYYMNAAIDVVVYAFSSATFRKTVVIAWGRILCPKHYNEADNKSKLITEQTQSRFSNRASAIGSRRDSRDHVRSANQSFRVQNIPLIHKKHLETTSNV